MVSFIVALGAGTNNVSWQLSLLAGLFTDSEELPVR
jgi:hypothetical protein